MAVSILDDESDSDASTVLSQIFSDKGSDDESASELESDEEEETEEEEMEDDDADVDGEDSAEEDALPVVDDDDDDDFIDEDSDEEEEPSLDDLDEAPDLIASREDFESMMDEFLEKYEVISGKMRPVLPGTATEKLETIRKALGEAKIRDDAGESDAEDDDILMPLDIDDKKDRWDCETILSMFFKILC